MEIDLSSEAPGGAVTAFAVADPVGALPDLDPRLAHLTESGELQGTSGATSVLHLDDGGHLVAAGAGRRDELDADSIRDAAAAVARLRLGATVAWRLDDSLPLPVTEQARAVVDGLVLGGYDRASGRRARPRRSKSSAWPCSRAPTRRGSWRSARSALGSG